MKQILRRYKMLAPGIRVCRFDPYLTHAAIDGKRDALLLSCSQRGTVRLEYIDVCGKIEAELILSPEHILVKLVGPTNITGLLVYVAQQVVPNLGNRFHSDPGVILAKQSETYQKLVAGETDVLSVVHKLEAARHKF
jgi:hypothetical protein